MNTQTRLAQYAPIHLAPDLSPLSDSERRILPLLLDAAQAMDDAFWIQNYGDREALLAAVDEADVRRLIMLNYGPWDRVREHEPFVEEVGPRPPGANFYPPDVTREEFEAGAEGDPALKSPYTMVRRDEQGRLVAIPYHRFFREQVRRAADCLQRAAELAQESGLKTTYLKLRAGALLTDDFRPSDYAWMEMRASTLDVLIGPMEIADRLFGLKTAYAASILVKDWEWSERLARYTDLLPRFQEHLPVPDAYKQERPALDGDLGVYDVLHYAGYDRASPPLGIAWPDDEDVQLRKGTRSLLLRNVMKAHFEQILAPLADLLVAADQRPYVTAEANFQAIMLHELAHGLGIKHTITGQGSVREALGEQDFGVEENKADLLSLVMMGQLHEWGMIGEAEQRQGTVTWLARLLYNCDGERSIARLNFFKEAGAISRDAGSGAYRVHLERVPAATTSLAERILRLQGDGDYEGAKAFLEQYGKADKALQGDMERLDAAGIPLVLSVAMD